MKKKFLCLLLGIWLCLSFSLPLYALDGPINADDNAELVRPTLEMTTVPTDAAAVGHNLSTNQTYYYHVNGNVLPTSADGSISEPGSSTEAVSPDAIIGDDNRLIVKPNKMTTNPYYAIAYVYITFPDGTTGNGTATMISPNAAVTAAHILYDSRHGGWPTSITVYPAIYGSADIPYLPYGFSTATELAISVPFFETENLFYGDWAVIRLSHNIATSRFLGFQYISQNVSYDANPIAITISGYPDYPNIDLHTINQYRDTNFIDEDIWDTTTASNNTVYDDRTFEYDIDATDGQSGAPLLYYNNGTYQIIGVHSREPSGVNQGFGFTYQVFNFLLAYKNNS